MVEQKKTSIDDKVEAILHHIERMDRRDRLRTIGGFFRSIIGLIPIAITIGFIWYFYNYGDDFLAKIAEQAAKQAAAVTQKSSEGILNQVRGLIPQ